MFNNSPSLKIFCVVAILSFTLTHQYELFEFKADLFYNVENLNQEKNVIISPLLVETAIGMLHVGARGETAAEINKPFNKIFNNMNVEEIRSQYRLLAGYLESDPYATIGNKIYVDESLQVNEDNKKYIEEYFHSSIEAVDFLCAEETADSINEFVKKQTNNSITQLVQPDTFTEDTKIFLVNAITFNGVWKYKFDETKTTASDFYMNNKNKIKVPMMFQLGNFVTKYYQNLKATSLLLPYAEDGFSFVIFLPNTSADFDFLKTNLKHFDLDDLKNGELTSTYVYLPKFKVEFDYDLKNVLQNMGLNKSFSDSGDFGGILKSNNIPLSVPKFIHKVVINVDEKGSNEPDADYKRKFKLFNANRPFIYIILDLNDDFILSGSYKGAKN